MASATLLKVRTMSFDINICMEPTGFNDFLKMSEDAIDDYFWDYHCEWASDEAEYHRLMWGMCRDHYERAVMLDAWKNQTMTKANEILYQIRMMDSYRDVVVDYMNKAPTWLDSSFR